MIVSESKPGTEGVEASTVPGNVILSSDHRLSDYWIIGLSDYGPSQRIRSSKTAPCVRYVFPLRIVDVSKGSCSAADPLLQFSQQRTTAIFVRPQLRQQSEGRLQGGRGCGPRYDRSHL